MFTKINYQLNVHPYMHQTVHSIIVGIDVEIGIPETTLIRTSSMFLFSKSLAKIRGR